MVWNAWESHAVHQKVIKELTGASTFFEPCNSSSSKTDRHPTIVAFILLMSLHVAPRVPPVAIKSSTTKTRWPGRMLFFCISNTS